MTAPPPAPARPPARSPPSDVLSGPSPHEPAGLAGLADPDSPDVDPLLALAELDAVLAAPRPLAPRACARLLDLLPLVPGRRRQVAEALARDLTPAAVDALLHLAPQAAPGVAVAVHRAIRAGICRDLDGHPAPHLLALDFRPSRARAFPPLLARAQAAFGPWLDRLRVGDQRWYRLALWPSPALRRHLATHGQDLLWLHAHLGKLRGARLWLNGWCIPAAGPWSHPTQVHLVHAWLDHQLAPRH